MNVLDTFRLDGKTALVTGCKRGIGFGMAKALASVDRLGLSETGADPVELLRNGHLLQPGLVTLPAEMGDEVCTGQDGVRCAGFQPHLAVPVGIDTELDDVERQHLHLADFTGL